MVVDKIFIADTETLRFFIYFFLCVSVTQWLHSISTCMTPVNEFLSTFPSALFLCFLYRFVSFDYRSVNQNILLKVLL